MLGSPIEHQRRLPRQNTVLKAGQVCIDGLDSIHLLIGRCNGRPKKRSARHLSESLMVPTEHLSMHTYLPLGCICAPKGGHGPTADLDRRPLKFAAHQRDHSFKSVAQMSIHRTDRVHCVG